MSLESTPQRRPPRVLDDPIVIRALAHPIRLKLYELVGRDGPITAAAAAPDQRGRPWRVTDTSFGLEKGATTRESVRPAAPERDEALVTADAAG